MNKKHFGTALTLIAIAGSASAQISVTIAGLMDINIGSFKDTLPRTQHVGATTKVERNGLSTSFLAFKGVEDLGTV